MAVLPLVLEPGPWGRERARLELAWDPEVGTLSGPGAATLQAVIDEAVTVGGLIGAPMATVYEITDPLHRRDEMAVVIANSGWHLPPELEADYPEPEADEPPADAEN